MAEFDSTLEEVLLECLVLVVGHIGDEELTRRVQAKLAVRSLEFSLAALDYQEESST